MTGGGNTTATRRQVEIIKAWGIDIICSFPAYLRHLAITARDELKLDPGSLGVRALHSHIGIEHRARIEALWNAPCYDMYGRSVGPPGERRRREERPGNAPEGNHRRTGHGAACRQGELDKLMPRHRIT
jgi:phenylacetate-coenzyme A ligase PaaK-like adenylate-forming protein